MTPLDAVTRGLAAGVFGTAVMTGWQDLSTRLRATSEDDAGGPPEPQDSWEQAPTPAKVARKLLTAAFHRDPPPERIGVLTATMHWGYGTSWGVLYGPIHRHVPGSWLRSGLLFGSAVWVASYLTLVPMGLYEPPWRYGAAELALDLSYHLAYGAGVGSGHAVVERLTLSS